MSARSRSRAPWSADEDRILRLRYSQSGGPARVARLTGRSLRGVYQRALALGLRAKRSARPWDAREDRTLRLEWGEVSVRTLRQKLPGRTWHAIYCRARDLGLGSAAQGRVAVAEAARIAGFSWRAMFNLLRSSGVPLRRHAGGMRAHGVRKAERWLVDPDEVREAVERRLAAETISQAAARVGLSAAAMRVRLDRAGVLRRGTPGKAVYYERAEVDRACADFRRTRRGKP